MSIHQFFLPVILEGDQQVRAEFGEAALQGAALGRPIASWGTLLQPTKDLHTGDLWLREHPGRNLLPFPLKGVGARAPVMRSPRFLILLLARLFEQRRRGVRQPITRHQILGAVRDLKAHRSGNRRRLRRNENGVLP